MVRVTVGSGLGKGFGLENAFPVSMSMLIGSKRMAATFFSIAEASTSSSLSYEHFSSSSFLSLSRASSI